METRAVSRRRTARAAQERGNRRGDRAAQVSRRKRLCRRNIHPQANEFAYVLFREWEEEGVLYTTGSFFFARAANCTARISPAPKSSA